MKIINCDYCGKEFQRKSNVQKFCSNECFNQGPKTKLRLKRWYINNPIKTMLHQASCRVKRKGLVFNLTTEDINIPSHCPVLNIKLVKHHGEPGCHFDSPSLDRIDNTKGYEKRNIIVVSNRANTIKNDSTFEELERVYLFYKNLQCGL